MNGFRVGDVVEVKSVAEILATLDASGDKDGMPFMPEMLRFAGRKFVVDQTADKICDTIHYSGSRQVPDAVLLGDLRCDGSGHDGCEAECRLFWKKEWLRPSGDGAGRSGEASEITAKALAALAARNAKATQADGAARYRCQATQLVAASRPLKLWDPRAYLRVLTSGNVGIRRFLRVMLRALIEEPRRKLGFRSDLALAVQHNPSRSPASEPVGLKAGDSVRVKTPAEIALTLNQKGRNRGLWFDREMVPFCGGTFRVRRRLKQFINEQDGSMIRLTSDCLTLDGVVCSGDRSSSRWFCPREIYPYWRESWLERAPNGETIAREETA